MFAAVAAIERIGGVCLALAALSFWLAWALMPLPGTTDPEFILAQVGATQDRVWWSVTVQLVSSALLVPGILAFAAAATRAPGAAFTVASLAGIGATGHAADAIYHLVAYEMVQPGVDMAAMLPVMVRFQSANLGFVAPQLVALLLGFAGLSWVGARAGLVPRANPRLYAAALALALLGAGIVRATDSGRRALALVVLGLIALALGWLGVALARRNANRVGR